MVSRFVLLTIKQLDIYITYERLTFSLFMDALNLVVNFNSIDWRFERWIKSRAWTSSLLHLFSLPFSIFSFIKFLTSLKTDALINTSSRTIFVGHLSAIPDFLENLTTAGTLLSIALTAVCKILQKYASLLKLGLVHISLVFLVNNILLIKIWQVRLIRNLL